jgi:hypothetical protein
VAGRSRPGRSTVLIGTLGFLTAAWLVIVLSAILTQAGACDDPTSVACTRHALATWQLIAAVAAGLPLGAAIWSGARGQGAGWGRWSVVMIAVLLLWGVLNDAAIHGWGNLRVF